MAADIQKVDLVDIDLSSGTIHRSWIKESIGMTDVKANAFGVRVFRDGAPVTLTTISVQGYFRDPHGNNIGITSGNSVSGNVAYVVLPAACYNYEGQFVLAIKLVGGGITGTVRIVDGMVDNTHTGGAITPAPSVATYDEVLAGFTQAMAVIEASVRYDVDQSSKSAADKAQARANIEVAKDTDVVRYDISQSGKTALEKAQARANIDAADVVDIAPVFNTSGKSLTAGSYVLDPVYKTLYRLKADVAQGTSWSTSLGDKVELADELTDKSNALKSAFNYSIENLIGDYNSTPGYINPAGWKIDTVTEAYKQRTSDFIPVIAGEKYSALLFASNAFRICVTYYSEKKDGDTAFIRQDICDDYSVYNNKRYNEFQFTIPTGCTYIRVYVYSCDESDYYLFNITKREPIGYKSLKADKCNTELTKYKNVLMVDNFIDISSYKSLPYNLESPSAWASSTAYRCIMIPVEDLTPSLKIVASNGKNVKYAFLRSGTIEVGQTPDYCNANDRVISVTSGNTKKTYIPEDCKYMYVYISTWTDFTGLGIQLLSYREAMSEIAKYPMLAPSYLQKIGIVPVELEQGTFNDNGLNQDSALRIRSREYIPVVSGNSYKIKAFPSNEQSAVKISVSFYTANDYTTARISVLSYAPSPFEMVVPENASYMRLLVAYTNDTTIKPEDVPGCIVEKPYDYNSGTDYVITADLQKKKVLTKYLGTLARVQAFCKYDGKYYSTDGENITVQASDFSTETTKALDVGHGNSLQLGNDGKAYASGWDDNMVYVVDLEELEVVSTIDLPTTGYTTCAVDDVNGFAYIFQRNSYPDSLENYNFIVYDYVNEQIISTKKTTNAFGGMQACDFVDGKIIVAYGFGTATVPSGLCVYNTNGDILADYSLSIFQSVEPEGVCFDRAAGKLLISLVNKYIYSIELA